MPRSPSYARLAGSALQDAHYGAPIRCRRGLGVLVRTHNEVGVACHLEAGYWTTSVPFMVEKFCAHVNVRFTGGRGERLVRGQALAQAT